MTTASSAVSRVLNFSAGPATLPLTVLQQIESELMALPGVGASVMEISHRSKEFDAILDDATTRIARLLNLPSTHEILFLQGGSALQNVMIPANFLVDENQVADYIITGSWGKKSAAEVKHYGKMNVAFNGADSGFSRVPSASEYQFSADAAYCHLTSNETIQGVQFAALPDTQGVPIVADKSSDMFAEPINVSDYGLIYACAQKNVGIAGVTLLVIDKALLERSSDRLPSYLNYANHSREGSRFNTPPTFAIYVTALVCKWLEEEIGGLEKMAELNRAKAKLLYDVIDGADGFYSGHAAIESRSTMNVVYTLSTDELTKRFLTDAADAGMTSLKGHRSLGGIRASIYNAMPVTGVEALAQFMQDFANKNG